jgi:catechol 2,3-dioxygenase-like lactoylglutathione lyase family enzyme
MLSSSNALGVDHIGVGVSDMQRSLAFYAELGFTEVAFDEQLELPGLNRVAGRPTVTARVAMLRPERPTTLGMASVKLVQTLDQAPPPIPAGIGWGEPGVSEICIHVKDQEALYKRLIAQGVESLMEPNSAPLTPYGTVVSLSYVADPDGTKIEMLEWETLSAGWAVEDGPQGINHVAFGVADIKRSADFYRELGFTGPMVFESDGFFEPMDPWYAPRTPPSQKMMLLTNPHGGGLEPVEHTPPSPPMHGEWGHLGSFDFGVGVRNIELAAAALRRANVELLCEPQTVALSGGGSFSYAYFADPDGTRVSLWEARY